MYTRLRLVMFTLTGGLITMTGPAQAGQNTPIHMAAGSALENTERNVRDKDGATLTPQNQKESQRDIDITATIRRTVVNDESLSVNAQNVKIITRQGAVVLRGPVETEAENLKLQHIAKQTPGVTQVDNQLENIAP